MTYKNLERKIILKGYSSVVLLLLLRDMAALGHWPISISHMLRCGGFETKTTETRTQVSIFQTP